MGNKILIKIKILLLFVVYLCADTNSTDAIFDKISASRNGLSPMQLQNIKNPFLNTSNQQETIQIIKNENTQSHKLQAIISNKVKINNVWYGLNDEIDIGKIVKISFSNVIIHNEKTGKVQILNMARNIANVETK
ncbi:hypothetical protein LMG7974_00056 [Campylobacter majalis]|uniref:Transformation system protein n=1 Tax=Campylobacter majalis TaxID=2790656 RepID=A0ABN7K7N1_9BACT|nr:hypothetical protein [Campylobacter majalis]CAD7286732.1 hypothetical protein LMG7974_00056 [Campylobacter majalis]